MQPDDEVCLCFHVTRRKIENYLRIHRPSRPSQLSQCGGAGTGCGWCVPFLRRYFENARPQPGHASAGVPSSAPAITGSATAEITSEQYASQRSAYIQRGKVHDADTASAGSPPSPESPAGDDVMPGNVPPSDVSE